MAGVGNINPFRLYYHLNTMSLAMRLWFESGEAVLLPIVNPFPLGYYNPAVSSRAATIPAVERASGLRGALWAGRPRRRSSGRCALTVGLQEFELVAAMLLCGAGAFASQPIPSRASGHLVNPR
jgi:hypothetical protein